MMIKHLIIIFFTFLGVSTHAQDTLFVSIPKQVTVGEQFRIAFVYKSSENGECSLKWEPNEALEVLHGPTQSMSTSMSITNGVTSRTHEKTFTYIVTARNLGAFYLNEAQAVVGGRTLVCPRTRIEVVKAGEMQPNAAGKKNSANGTSISAGKVSSSGRRVDGVVSNPFTFTRRSAVVSGVTGWCYNLDANKWVGNKGFISTSSRLRNASPRCEGLQLLHFTYEGARHGVLKVNMGGYYYYALLYPEDLESLRSPSAKGAVLKLRYVFDYKELESAESLFRGTGVKVETMEFSFKKDEGGVVRFSMLKNWSCDAASGVLEFDVSSSGDKLSGYFELSGEEWERLVR